MGSLLSPCHLATRPACFLLPDHLLVFQGRLCFDLFLPFLTCLKFTLLKWLHLNVSLILRSKCYAGLGNTFLQGMLAKPLNNVHLTEGRSWNSVWKYLWASCWDWKTMMSEINKLQHTGKTRKKWISPSDEFNNNSVHIIVPIIFLIYDICSVLLGWTFQVKMMLFSWNLKKIFIEACLFSLNQV